MLSTLSHYAIAYVALAVLMAWLAATGAMAVTAKGTWATFEQSDGTLITVRLCGNETMRYYVTTDGVPLVRTASGDFCYARATAFGMGSSGVLAHEAALRTAGEATAIATVEQMETLREAAPRAVARKRAAMARRNTATATHARPRHGLVIMVEFPDRQFIDDEAHTQWNDILNLQGYSQHGAMGCVADYFRDQSGGMLDIEFDLMGPVMASQSRYYYGANDTHGYDIDLLMDELVVEACQAIAANTDFPRYDWNGDGMVDQVFILYAGGGEAVTGADSRLIWPHEYMLSGYASHPNGYEIGGYVIDTYACGSELAGLERSSNNSLSGLGTFCHEFAHCLGLPDLYSYYGTDMLGQWDLMSEGNYNADGWCPPNFSAYEKYFCGWLLPTELNGPATITNMLPTAQGGEAYMVRNDAASTGVDEYYLIENRQQTGWDTHVPGSGIIVTHVDYNADSWLNNTVNDSWAHPGVAIIAANNGSRPTANIAYPYMSNDSLTDHSRPAARVYNRAANGTMLMGKPITNMAVDEGVASLVFMGGQQQGDNGTAGISSATSASHIIGQPATIFNMWGHEVGATHAFGQLPHSLPPGIYIAKTATATAKIVKK